VKRLFLLTLVAALLISSAAKTVLIADYLLNYDYIAKVLCINKDKPEMHCNGKCHLAKQLQQQDEQEQQSAGKSGITLTEIPGVLVTLQTFPLCSATHIDVAFAPLNGELTGASSACFHPPC
jgi:hypothetical protein